MTHYQQYAASKQPWSRRFYITKRSDRYIAVTLSNGYRKNIRGIKRWETGKIMTWRLFL